MLQLMLGAALVVFSIWYRGRRHPGVRFPRDAMFITTYIGGTMLVMAAALSAGN